MEPTEQSAGSGYPVQFSVEYPDRALNRLTSAFRLIVAIPIFILATSLSGEAWGSYGQNASHGAAVGGGGLLFLPPLLMIVFRQKYPRWWYDWNLELLRFSNRVGVYLALMDDRYPSTDERQGVSLDFPYPDAKNGLNRWLPLVKWLLAIPHYIVLFFLYVGAILGGDRRLVRDPLHGSLPTWPLRLPRRRRTLVEPCLRVFDRAGHRRVPAVPVEAVTRRATSSR